MLTIARISTTPVKNFRLSHPGRVVLGGDGVAGNRRFFLVGADGKRLRSSQTAWPGLVAADYDPDAETLRVRFPDGTEVEASALAAGETLVCEASAHDVEVRVVGGPWEAPLSRLAGDPVRLVRVEGPALAHTEPVTLVSSASIARFAREAGVADVDARRFRMLFEIAGCEAHEEDGWQGRALRVGDALVVVGGPIPRCAVTTRDPDSAMRDLDALRLIKAYRGTRESDGAVLFGVYARVERPGLVRVGSPVELAEAAR